MNRGLVGECCEVMKLALERRAANGMGLDIATGFNFKTGTTHDALVYHFRKARKDDAGKYGHGKKYAGSTFAPLAFCPFCGTKVNRRDATKTEDEEATP